MGPQTNYTWPLYLGRTQFYGRDKVWFGAIHTHIWEEGNMRYYGVIMKAVSSTLMWVISFFNVWEFSKNDDISVKFLKAHCNLHRRWFVVVSLWSSSSLLPIKWVLVALETQGNLLHGISTSDLKRKKMKPKYITLFSVSIAFKQAEVLCTH